MRSPRIALVTGADQGIGDGLVEELAARWTEHDLVLLTGRDPARVTDAVTRAAANPGTGARIEGRHLDVSVASAVRLPPRRSKSRATAMVALVIVGVLLAMSGLYLIWPLAVTGAALGYLQLNRRGRPQQTRPEP